MSVAFEERRKLNSVPPKLANQPTVIPIDDATIRHQSQLYWDWRAAFERDPAASPLQHPDIILAELAKSQAKTQIKPVAIRESSGRERYTYAIVLPKSIRTSLIGGVGPDRRLEGLRIAGGRMLGEIVSPEQEARLLRCAAKYAADTHANFLLIEDLEESSSLCDAVHDQASHGCLLFVTHDFQPHHYIDFPATEAEYLNTFSSHCRKLFRRALKKCSHARLQRVTEVHELPDFLDAAHEISRKSWQSTQFGMRIRNDETELNQLTALAMHGMLRCYLFWIDDKPAAFAVGNQHSGCFRYEETAFAPEYRQYSPGRTMLLQIISDLHQHNAPKCLDFGLGDAEYKRQFSNRVTSSGTLWLVPPTLRARMSLAHLNVSRSLRSAIYSTIKQSSLGVKARQWIRSQCGCVEAAPSPNSADAAESGDE